MKAVQKAKSGALLVVKSGAVPAVQSGDKMKGGGDDLTEAGSVGEKFFIKVMNIKIHFQ